jgi:hypothetical protein
MFADYNLYLRSGGGKWSEANTSDYPAAKNFAHASCADGRDYFVGVYRLG